MGLANSQYVAPPLAKFETTFLHVEMKCR